MTNRPVAGLLLALIVELAHWAKFRWDFNEETSGRAWQLTTIGITLAGVLIYLDESPYTALPKLLTWMPPLLLPMQFIQSYGMSPSLPLNTFSFLAKRRRRRNLRLGLTESVIHINFGNIYFAAIMVAATLGDRSSSILFLPGIIILTGWMLLAASRSRPFALVVALTVAGGIAVAGQKGLQSLDGWYGNSDPRPRFDPNNVSTLIGRPGPVQQSRDIVWRIKTLSGKVPPKLLKTAGYNSYRMGKWGNRPLLAAEFNDLDNRLADGVAHYLLTQDATELEQIRATRKSLPRFNLRGAAFAETPLPIPGDAASLRDFELDGIERNPFGTVRVYPKQSIIDGTILWQGDLNTEDPPIDEVDLDVPRPERWALRMILRDLKIEERATLEEKLATLRGWFQREFKYSRQLTILGNSQFSTSPTAIGQFLGPVKSGHCEYFATATTLLLRQAGIPARYATGYAVIERDSKRGEYIIRGTHGHAWVRVWDQANGKWRDFDTTPGDWLSMISQQESPFTQRLADALLRLREDFFVWRNQPQNRNAATLIMAGIGLGVAGFILRRLWRSRRRIEKKALKDAFTGPTSSTPLNALERHAERHLGSRPPGQPFGAWLMRLRQTLTDSSALEEAIDLHQRLRFDPLPQHGSQHQRLAELAKRLELSIRRSR
jgi:protein-glutamine gamma-glutamyltransferase